MKTRTIALALGFIATCGLSSIASAGLPSDMGRCSDPQLINSPACDGHAERAGVSNRARNMLADGWTAVDCDQKAEKLGAFEIAGKRTQGGNVEL